MKKNRTVTFNFNSLGHVDVTRNIPDPIIKRIVNLSNRNYTSRAYKEDSQTAKKMIEEYPELFI